MEVELRLSPFFFYLCRMLKINDNLPLPTSEYILENISDYQIFKFYFPEYDFKGNTNSPLRKDDLPSFSIFYSEKYGKLLFYDHATKDKGDCFVFVSQLFRINYFEALCKICADFGLSDVSLPTEFKKSIRKRVPRKDVDYSTINKVISIRVKTKPYTKEELLWWSSQGIGLETLQKYNVFSIKKVFINSWIINTDFSFGYLEAKDGIYTWKIYSPLNLENKWINNADKSVIQGFSQLPETGDTLIISKSLKDSMSIIENNNIYSCSIQSESGDIKLSVMSELKSRFKDIYLLMDNDKAGLRYGNELGIKHNIKTIFIPNTHWKDYTDMFKAIGKYYSVKILNKLITNNKNK
jgi:hypothetical protein